MQKEKNILTSLFEKIFSGTASRKELEQGANWLSQLDISNRGLTDQEIEQQRLRFQATFREKYIDAQPIKRRNRRFLSIPAAAAAMVIIVVGVVVYGPKQKLQPQPDIVVQISTKTGEHKIVILPDSSRITLNNSSRLKFPQQFHGNTREIYLEGEAFFDVAHAKEPFIVHSGDFKITVLGTSFNLNNYPADEHGGVTVTTGKIGVQIPGRIENWTMIPGQQLAYNRILNSVDKLNVRPDDCSAWQRGEMVFINEPLEDICHRLERRYGVPIRIQTPSLKYRHINLSQKSERLQNIIKMLGIAASFKYRYGVNQIDIW